MSKLFIRKKYGPTRPNSKMSEYEYPLARLPNAKTSNPRRRLLNGPKKGRMTKSRIW